MKLLNYPKVHLYYHFCLQWLLEWDRNWGEKILLEFRFSARILTFLSRLLWSILLLPSFWVHMGSFPCWDTLGSMCWDCIRTTIRITICMRVTSQLGLSATNTMLTIVSISMVLIIRANMRLSRVTNPSMIISMSMNQRTVRSVSSLGFWRHKVLRCLCRWWHPFLFITTRFMRVMFVSRLISLFCSVCFCHLLFLKIFCYNFEITALQLMEQHWIQVFRAHLIRAYYFETYPLEARKYFKELLKVTCQDTLQSIAYIFSFYLFLI